MKAGEPIKNGSKNSRLPCLCFGCFSASVAKRESSPKNKNTNEADKKLNAVDTSSFSFYRFTPRVDENEAR